MFQHIGAPRVPSVSPPLFACWLGTGRPRAVLKAGRDAACSPQPGRHVSLHPVHLQQRLLSHVQLLVERSQPTWIRSLDELAARAQSLGAEEPGRAESRGRAGPSTGMFTT